MQSFLEKVDMKQEIDENYECFYDFLDMLSFEVAKYFKPFLPLKNNDGVNIDDPAVLTRDIYNTTERYFKNRCALDPKKVNFDQFASFFVTHYKDHLTDHQDLKLIEEDIIDVMTDTARKEIYN
jgi:hypothetical protein